MLDHDEVMACATRNNEELNQRKEYGYFNKWAK